MWGQNISFSKKYRFMNACQTWGITPYTFPWQIQPIYWTTYVIFPCISICATIISFLDPMSNLVSITFPRIFNVMVDVIAATKMGWWWKTRPYQKASVTQWQRRRTFSIQMTTSFIPPTQWVWSGPLTCWSECFSGSGYGLTCQRWWWWCIRLGPSLGDNPQQPLGGGWPTRGSVTAWVRDRGWCVSSVVHNYQMHQCTTTSRHTTPNQAV